MNDYLTGEFNGTDVNVFVATNNNKVYRIMVADKNYISESDIKIRFNKLVSQFEKNKKYIRFSDDHTLSDEENISFEMTVNSKRYQASYCQVPCVAGAGSLAVSNEIASFSASFLTSKYTAEELAELTDEEKGKLAMEALTAFASKYSVWFMIDRKYGKYGILMYYDNGFNQSDGEDL